ncbi:MAG TPA: hypothetical protein VFL31_07265, partial [Nitrospiraceae bacterium]|nr:hypothetical protein [Nitrospiraceae bacterium]
DAHPLTSYVAHQETPVTPLSVWYTREEQEQHATARNQRGVEWKSLRTGKRQYVKEELHLNGTEQAKHLGTRSSSGK